MALTAVSPESGNEFVDSFINNGRHYVNGEGVAGPFVINYYFGELAGTEIDGRNYGYTWRPIEKAAYRSAVQGWEHVANVTFNEVSAQTDALFVERLENQATAGGTVSASHSLPNANASAQSLGTYNFEAVNIRQWTPDTLEPGGNFYRTFIHETGHGLGLKHPHDSGSGAFSPNYFPGIDPTDTSAERQRSLGVLELNHMFGSVMSYLHGYEFDDQGRIDLQPTRQRPVAEDYFLEHGFAATPMAYDIAAIQYLYGANTTYANGDNVYVLPDSNDPAPFVRGEPNEAGVPESIIYQPDTAFWSCIWDTGGTDEMRYDGNRNAILDLTAATLDQSATGYGVLSYAAFIGGGYTIANGVVIENATGGEGNDLITGNAVANLLVGRGGNDTLVGGAGADRLSGGAGADVYRGTAADLDGDTILEFDKSDTVEVQGLVTAASLEGESLSFVVDGVTRRMTINGANAVPVSVTAKADGVSTIRFSSDTASFGDVVRDLSGAGGQTYAAYDAVFGRDATGLELERGAAALGGGTSLAALATTLLASPEGQALYGSLDNAAFVNQLYQTGLGRTADPEGAAGWVAFLNGGGSRGDVVAGFAVSAENAAQLAPELAVGVFVPDAEAAAVARLYHGLLGRAPDAAGLASWTDYVEGGGSLTSVADAFLISGEYQARSPGLSDSAFVDALYTDALGRAPDTVGAVGWNLALAGGASRADVAIGIAESPEAALHLAGAIEQSYTLAS
ncbi:DUF4214 domain-containing protein [Methylobacterium tarhaniae]|uniref:DUF4214 domain-containing protein n=1 Tax=Methylobacterium tarhaniae TaxID=1187852 RepID=UPI003D080A05